ncbi:MAG: hypothetical protein PHS92_01050 [Candidatus Gracilibacteria bacterium]|nr:hypothetical protein [Candidatus Gracilibacteria bacterium]
MARKSAQIETVNQQTEKSIEEKLKEIKSQLSSGESLKLNKTIENLNVSRKKLELLKKASPKSQEIKRLEDEVFKLEREEMRVSHFLNLKYKGNEKHKAIIGKNESSDNLKASDILFLKKTGADLSKFLLVRDGNATGKVSEKDIKENDKFIVNFGENQNMNNIIGAGDILPYEVNSIKINGVEGIRRNMPRPGYYEALPNGKFRYLRIFDGDKIEIIKMKKINDSEIKEFQNSDEKRFEKLRIEDTIHNNGNAITDLQEDKDLIEKAKKVKEEEEKRMDRIKDIYKIDGKDGFEGTVKKLKDLNFDESKTLLISIFGEGPATRLLIKIDGGSTFAIKRMIALAKHEGGFKFGRRNPDPASGFNIGTFQIGGSGSNESDSLKKFNNCLDIGVKMAEENKIDVDFASLDNAQKDLLAHLGYIQEYRGGKDKGTFEKLKDPNLSDSEVIKLMSREIQGGIPAIGKSVVSQLENASVKIG